MHRPVNFWIAILIITASGTLGAAAIIHTARMAVAENPFALSTDALALPAPQTP